MLLLNCDNLISSCCSDYALARILSIFNNILQLIHIIVPIILIVMATFNLYQLMSNPEEKKLKKKMINKILATVIVFMIPTFVNAVLGILPNSYDIHGCMEVGKQLSSTTRNTEATYTPVDDEKKTKAISSPDEYEKGEEKKDKTQNTTTNTNTDNNTEENNTSTNSKEDNKGEEKTTSTENNTSSQSTSSRGGKGPVLLIAGHSYPPYCEQVSNECRGKSKSGYAEEDETRKLVKLIKSNLDNMNVQNDIANALLAGNYDQMNKSFFIESKKDTELFNKFDWSKYVFVLEVHFNATSQSNASGTLLCKKSESYSTKADDDIVNAVISHTGKSRLRDSIQQLNDVSYFTKRNIPIVYLETEFYDNASAMQTYINHINEIAHDIAAAIKKHYG